MTASSPPPLHCLIADDDSLACDTVEAYLQRAARGSSCLKVGDGLTALHLLASTNFDLIFLDMHMPGLEGTELLRALPRGIPVIIISASNEFAVHSYEFDAIDYLVKPSEFGRFCVALNKARQRMAKTPTLATIAENPDNPSAEPDPNGTAAGAGKATEAIFVKDGTKLVRISLSQLHFVKSEANYVDFYCKTETVTSLMSLRRLDELLPESFIRVHRSYIVNLVHIARVEDGQIHVGKHKIPIGDFYREEFLRRLKVVQ